MKIPTVILEGLSLEDGVMRVTGNRELGDSYALA